MTIRSAVERITPEMAQKILEGSKDIQNRSVSDGHVEWLASQMRTGKWLVNGEAIIFDDHGLLIDGQHRLWAIVLSGAAIESLVTRGVDRKTFVTIDTGSARTTGNVLSIMGEKNANALSSALGWVHRREVGKMLWDARYSGYTSAVAVALLRKHPGIRDAMEWAVANRKSPIFGKISGSALIFLRYALVSHKPIKAAEFFDLVGDVVPDSAGTATRTLRNWYLTRGGARRTTAASTTELMAVTIKAWAAFLNGTPVTKLLWRRRGKYPESFPIFPGDSESKGLSMRAIPIVAKAR